MEVLVDRSEERTERGARQLQGQQQGCRREQLVFRRCVFAYFYLVTVRYSIPLDSTVLTVEGVAFTSCLKTRISGL